ncbi:MAG: metal-dependent hydrolase [Panacagrimonas sp.]
MNNALARRKLVPRHPQALDFADGIAVNWANGDVFRSRFFDAFSTTLPEGEKFFIVSLRQFKDRLQDPELQQELKDFIRQEGVHGILHNAYNNRLGRQGVDIERITQLLRKFFAAHEQVLSPRMQLTLTACAEHLTASMAHTVLGHGSHLFDGADERVRALYFWHAAEEIEHKSVAFDLLKNQARVGYIPRVLMMAYISIVFHALVFPILEHVLRSDGYTARERAGLWSKGLWWMFKPQRGGFYFDLLGHYLSWFKPGFEPWDHGDLKAYDRWIQAYADSGDVHYATQATYTVLGKAA